MKRTVRWQLVASRQPECEMSTGRVANEDDTLKIEAVLWCQLANEVGGLGHILVCSRPAAAVVTKAPILDIPCRDSAFSKGNGQWSEKLQRRSCLRKLPQLGRPAPSVHEDCERMIARAIWHAKLTELQGAAGILKAFAGNCCLPEQVGGTRGLSVERGGMYERQHRNGRCH